MRRLLVCLLALLLTPALAPAEEEWPDLTGEWSLATSLVDGVYHSDGGCSYALSLKENNQAVYRCGDELLQGVWATPTPEQVVFMDLQGWQTSFTLVDGRLAGADGDVYFSLTRPEQPVVRPWKPLENAGHVPGFDLVARSEALELYARADTGEVAIYDLRSGRTVWSNPQDADRDKQANRTTRRKLKSQFYLEYVDTSGYTSSFQSWVDAVEQGGLTAWTIPGGVAFGYEISQEQTLYCVPHYLPDARYQELYQAADASVQRLMHGQQSSFYEQRSDGGWYMTENGKKMSIRSLSRVSDAFLDAGMTEDEYWYWQSLVGVMPVEERDFSLVMEWTLEGDTLTCCIPAESIVEHGSFRLIGVEVAPWLGAVKDQSCVSCQVEAYAGLIDAVPGERETSYPLRKAPDESLWENNQDYFGTSRAVMSGEEGAILMSVPCMPRYARFTLVPAGEHATYGSFYYSMAMRERYSYDPSNTPGVDDFDNVPGRHMPVYSGELLDVTVSYSFLTEPYKLSEVE